MTNVSSHAHHQRHPMIRVTLCTYHCSYCQISSDNIAKPSRYARNGIAAWLIVATAEQICSTPISRRPPDFWQWNSIDTLIITIKWYCRSYSFELHAEGVELDAAIYRVERLQEGVVGHGLPQERNDCVNVMTFSCTASPSCDLRCCTADYSMMLYASVCCILSVRLF